METEIKKGDVGLVDGILTIYEVSYLLLPSIALEQITGKVTSIKKMLSSVGAQTISDESPVLIDLSYPMTKVVQTVRHKCTSGYFGWIKFEATKEAITAIKKNFDMDGDILRYLIIKTVRENTLLGGKMKLKFEEVKRPLGVGPQGASYDGEVTEAPVATKDATPEEIDKSIDDLVIV